MIDYTAWADEYRASAQNIKKAIKKYEALLKTSKNKEAVNGKLSYYHSVYRQMNYTANMIENRRKQ